MRESPTSPHPWILLLPLLLGCGANPLAQSWQLDRLRILAVKGEPAEPRPGETVVFDSLLYLPEGQTLNLLTWFACLPEDSNSFGCTTDPSVTEELAGLDPKTLSEEELAALREQLAEAGLIGAEPWLPPSWTVPADALDGLSEEERNEGVSALVSVTAIPERAVSASDLELAFKRIPVSEALTPNHNPVITGFRVDGEEVGPEAVIQLGWGETPTIEVLLAEDAIETYLFLTEEGEEEERLEEPYVSWFAEAGEFDQPYALYPYLDIEWTAPAARLSSLRWPVPREPLREVRLSAVVRDRRGGMGWASLRVELSDAP